MQTAEQDFAQIILYIFDNNFYAFLMEWVGKREQYKVFQKAGIAKIDWPQIKKNSFCFIFGFVIQPWWLGGRLSAS